MRGGRRRGHEPRAPGQRATLAPPEADPCAPVARIRRGLPAVPLTAITLPAVPLTAIALPAIPLTALAPARLALPGLALLVSTVRGLRIRLTRVVGGFGLRWRGGLGAGRIGLLGRLLGGGLLGGFLGRRLLGGLLGRDLLGRLR